MRGVYVLAICAVTTIGGAASAQEIDWKKVDEALGRSAAVSGDVHRYGFPRSDLTVTLDGVTIRPTLALGGWTAFKPAHGGAMVMGDLVLLETEINPVMAALPPPVGWKPMAVATPMGPAGASCIPLSVTGSRRGTPN